MNVPLIRKRKPVTLLLALSLLGLLILPIPVSAQNETWYKIWLGDDGDVGSTPFKTIGNSVGTRFKTKYVKYGFYVFVDLELGDVFSAWKECESLGAAPGTTHYLEEEEWIFHHIHMYSKTMECVFILRFESDQGFDQYTLRLILHDTGKGADTYEDEFADVEIEQGAQRYSEQKKGPKKTMFHIKDKFTASIAITIENSTPP